MARKITANEWTASQAKRYAAAKTPADMRKLLKEDNVKDVDEMPLEIVLASAYGVLQNAVKNILGEQDA